MQAIFKVIVSRCANYSSYGIISQSSKSHKFFSKTATCIPLIPIGNSSRFICSGCLWPTNLPTASEWNYENNGPASWSAKWPHAGGDHQSPVDIVSSSVKGQGYKSPLRWHYEKSGGTLLDAGCGWRADMNSGNSEIFGGPLSESYELVQFHCHWGTGDDCGSEHTIDSKAYSGELHFVHWNKERFTTCDTAVSSPFGLVVVGVLLQEGEKNSEIEKLCQTISKFSAENQRVVLPQDLNILSMFPANHSYWTYSGSLTTPPCYESVTWILFKNTVSISKDQLACFRSMRNASRDDFVLHNCRPVQSLNGRQIFESH